MVIPAITEAIADMMPGPVMMELMPLTTLEGLHRATARGAELRYLRAGSGRPIVLLHTLRTQLDYFRPLLQHLDTRQVEVIAIDLPGHGESSAPRVDYTADYFTDVVEALLEVCELRDALVVGESIGASIALALAARGDPRLARVVALNPYDYGRWGGIRRSSPLANMLFTAMLWPAIGSVVAHTETKGILRRVLEGGLHDPRNLPPDLVDELSRCGALPGHARAFRSLCREWRSWIAARTRYAAIDRPVTLVYGEDDWSRPVEREANGCAIPGARTTTMANSGHFSALEQPQEIAKLIAELL
jgi:pimeloyl-ACP methyl ester carboxylesterase